MSPARSSTPSRRRGVPVNGHRVTYGRRFVGLGGGQAGAHCPIEPSPLCFHCPLSSPDGHPGRGFPGWMMDDGSSIAIRPRIRIRPGSTVDVLALESRAAWLSISPCHLRFPPAHHARVVHRGPRIPPSSPGIATGQGISPARHHHPSRPYPPLLRPSPQQTVG